MRNFHSAQDDMSNKCFKNDAAAVVTNNHSALPGAIPFCQRAGIAPACHQGYINSLNEGITVRSTDRSSFPCFTCLIPSRFKSGVLTVTIEQSVM